MDDDIWGDITQPQSEEWFHFLQNERNYQFNKIYNSGYRDGLEAEVDTILDEEFNKGFKIGNRFNFWYLLFPSYQSFTYI